VTHNVAVDDVFKYFTDNRCQGYGSVIWRRVFFAFLEYRNNKGVFKLLKDLNPHKATRPDYTVIYTKECCGRIGTNFNATIPVLTSRRRNTIWLERCSYCWIRLLCW
jgi:hypothetical protein